MTDHQKIRNKLSDIEDRARRERNTCNDPEIYTQLTKIITQLTKIIREEIVK